MPLSPPRQPSAAPSAAAAALPREGADLHRFAPLPGDAPRRAPDRAGQLGSVAGLDLLAREYRVCWKAAGEAAAPSPAACPAEGGA